MRPLLFAANWKMHLAPPDARSFMQQFLPGCAARPGRDVWFFPTALAVETVAQTIAARADVRVGVQDVYWEAKGAFTGAISAPLAAQSGARAALVGHSERRHVFGESDADTRKKVVAVLDAGLTPVLCVGEKLAERDADQTLAVTTRQLTAALDGMPAATLDAIVIAYEPVWAIGTGRNATPADAALVHRHIRSWLRERGAASPRVLYGGSVNLKNIGQLLAERELDGVLVGGASLDPVAWAQLVQTDAA